MGVQTKTMMLMSEILAQLTPPASMKDTLVLFDFWLWLLHFLAGVWGKMGKGELLHLEQGIR